MSLRDNYHGRFTDMTRTLCQGKKFRIAPVPHVISGRVAATLVSSDNNGNVASVQTHSTTLGQDKSDHSSDSQKLTGSKISSFRSQDKKKHSSIKEGTKTLQSYSSNAYIPGASQPFTHIFGTPIKTKPSPEQAGKQKEGSAAIQSNQKIGSGHTKPSKTSSSHPSNNSQLSTKEKVGRAAKEKSPHDKESKDTKHTKHLKHPEKESKQLSVKRQSSPSHASERKRKRTTSTSSESNSAAPQPASSAEKKGDTPKSKHREVKVKEKHKTKQANSADNGNSSAHRKEKSKDKSKTSKKLAVENNVSPLHQANQRTNDTHTDGNSAQSMQSEEKVDVSLVETKEDSVLQAEDLNSSPSSSISLSSLPPVGSHGPLATMMAEMEKDLLSPLSSEPGSHSLSNSPILKDKSEDNHAGNSDAGVSQNMVTEQVNKEALEEELFGKVKDESESVKDKKDDIEQGNKLKKDQTLSIKKKRDEVDGRSHEEMASKSSVRGGKLDDKVSDKDRKRILQFDQVYINELIDLQRKIMALRDRHIIQKIVNVIEESGNFDVTKTSLDFDLCRLDQMTVRKLQNCLAVK